MHEKAHECGCHGDGGCGCPVEERIKAMELTKELMLHRVRCMERKIQEMKKEAKKSGGK
jgi:hypothetical protein